MQMAGCAALHPPYGSRKSSERDFVVEVGVGGAAAAGGVEHCQFAAEAGQHDFGRVFLDAGVVGPFAGLQGALDIDLGALAQVFLGEFGEPLVEDHDAVPLGALLALARHLVAPALGGREVQIGDAHAVLGRADFGVAAEIADENDLVDAASHGSPRVHEGRAASYQVPRMFPPESYPPILGTALPTSG